MKNIQTREEMVLLIYSACCTRFELMHFIKFIFSATAHLSDLKFLIVDVQRQRESFSTSHVFDRVSVQLDLTLQGSCRIMTANTNVVTGMWGAWVRENRWQSLCLSDAAWFHSSLSWEMKLRLWTSISECFVDLHPLREQINKLNANTD